MFAYSILELSLETCNLSCEIVINYQGQRCWMGMLDGELEETYFRFKSTGCTRGEGPLEQTESRYYTQYRERERRDGSAISRRSERGDT